MMKDYTGIVMNRLTFLGRAGKKSSEGKELWDIQCECGRIFQRVPSMVVSNNMRQCPTCWRPNAGKDYTGVKINFLTLLKEVEKKNGKRLWQAECQCGDKPIVILGDVVKGRTKSCGCYGRGQWAANCRSMRKHHPMISSARSVWASTYNDGDISFDDFFKLSQLPCFYCGRKPFRVFNMATKRKGYNPSIHQKTDGYFTYNGLDRVDSSIKQHTLANVVPCCQPCNMAKGDMTQEEFILHNERQYLHMTSLREKL